MEQVARAGASLASGRERVCQTFMKAFCSRRRRSFNNFKVGDDSEGHVVNVRSAIATDIVERAFARFDRVRYCPGCCESDEEGARAQELPLSAMGFEVIVICMPDVIGA